MHVAFGSRRQLYMAVSDKLSNPCKPLQALLSGQPPSPSARR